MVPADGHPDESTIGGLPQTRVGVDLYWLPLGAGGHVVRWNGRIFEALVARRQHRRPCDLFHSALQVRLDGARYVIEQAPVWNSRAAERGAVREGPVGSARLGRWRLFRYEVRCWRDGVIPDLDEAVDSPQQLSGTDAQSRRVLELVADVPTPTWGRDELGTGEMWNSNSVVSWLLARSGHDTDTITPPSGGRAPGWAAGLALADR
ncbi:MAG: hypothetical protein WAL50_06225, partial [Kineosporiaceae bacterium]